MTSENLLPTLQALLATRGVHPDPGGGYGGYLEAYERKRDVQMNSMAARFKRALRAFRGEDPLYRVSYRRSSLAAAYRAYYGLF